MNKTTIVFDLGGVLIDWNPRYLYKDVFENSEEMEYFLQNICTNEWNELQDSGRSLEEATAILCHHFPEYEKQIKVYYESWRVMLNGAFPATVEILKKLIDQKYRVLALTNWSNETFPIAFTIYDFLSWFDGILVSGAEKMKKPDPAIFNLLIKRYQLTPSETIFIDDNRNNINTASKMGFKSIQYTDAEQLVLQLFDLGIQLD